MCIFALYFNKVMKQKSKDMKHHYLKGLCFLALSFCPGDRFAKACVKVNNTNIVNGLIIFPDTYSHPIGQTLRNVNEKGTVSYPVNYGDNTFTTDQWNAMEAAGAIFLPAAGYLDGTTVGEYGGQGDYWSSTTDDGEKAKRLEFKNTEVTTDNRINRSYGCSVRLVKEATR